VQKANVPSIPRAEKVLRRAQCSAAEAVGDCVRISGSKIGSLYQVRKMDPTVAGTDQAVGIVTKKYDATTCRVQLWGPMPDVYGSLVPGQRYWVDVDSTLTPVRPSPAPGGVLYLQMMGVALDDDELLVDPHMPMVMRG